MDRRRALLAGGGFPENYLFKEGLGFRKDLIRTYGEVYEAGHTVTKDSIYMYGSSEGGYSATLIINHGITFKSSTGAIQTVTNLDLSKYTKLCMETTDGGNSSRKCQYGIFVDGAKPTLMEISRDGTNSNTTSYSKPFLSFYGSSRTIHKLDISSKDSGTIIIRSPNYKTTWIRVYNIWLE